MEGSSCQSPNPFSPNLARHTGQENVGSRLDDTTSAQGQPTATQGFGRCALFRELPRAPSPQCSKSAKAGVGRPDPVGRLSGGALSASTRSDKVRHFDSLPMGKSPKLPHRARCCTALAQEG